MPAHAPATPPFPTRGVAGGFRDWCDGADDTAELRAQAEAAERRQLGRAAAMAPGWQREIRDERRGTPRHPILDTCLQVAVAELMDMASRPDVTR